MSEAKTTTISSARDLESRFGFDEGEVSLHIDDGRGTLPRVVLGHDGARAEVYLHGAHVTAYEPADQREVLFIGRSARYEPGKAIRGGIPICFPWFGSRAADPYAPSHGLARTKDWKLGGVGRVDGGVEAMFETRIEKLDVRYRVNLGSTFRVTLEATNIGDEATIVETAMHSYFAVGDIREGVAIEGLNGRTYLDQLQGRARVVEEAEALFFEAETDRVYLDTANRHVIIDPLYQRRLIVETEGCPSTVVWNPWIEKTMRMGDVEDDEWPKFVCLETGAIADDELSVEPGGVCRFSTCIEAVDLER